MKRALLLLGLLFIGTSVFAGIQGIEPPAEFMAALETCANGTYKTQYKGMISVYTIKGKTPTGRCIVEYSDYTDFSHKETYDFYISMMKSFGGGLIRPSDIPTQEQMIERGLKEKTITTCKFNSKERKMLYTAYKKHDGIPLSLLNEKPLGTKIDGFADKMSSYDALMMKFSHGPCTTTSANNPQDRKGSIYACEYADRTCYVTKYSNTSWTASCNPNIPGDFPWDILKKHVNQGMCEKI